MSCLKKGLPAWGSQAVLHILHRRRLYCLDTTLSFSFSLPSFSHVIVLILFAKCLDSHCDPGLISFHTLYKYVSESIGIFLRDFHSLNNLVMCMLDLFLQVDLQIFHTFTKASCEKRPSPHQKSTLTLFDSEPYFGYRDSLYKSPINLFI